MFIAYRLYRPKQKEGQTYRAKDWKVRIAVVVGGISVLTAPWIATLQQVVIGAYPTIDKEGSLLFFEHGVHHLWLTNPDMPLQDTGLPLIGVHIGHLWLTELIHLFVPTVVAFNIQMLLHLMLNVLAVIFWLDSDQGLPAKEWQKWVIGFLLGAQLHVFRDIHWYTIEKSALFPIFLFWGILHRLVNPSRESSLHWLWLPLAYCFAGIYNFYWAILLPFIVLGYLSHLKQRRFQLAIVACTLVGLVLGWGQWNLQSQQTYFASPEDFHTRAALDVFNLSTFDWNRMGFWRALNPLMVGGGVWMLYRATRIDRHWREMGLLFGITLLLSAGPDLVADVNNPLFALFQQLPGMWRFAKPEIFLLISYAIVGRAFLIQTWHWLIWVGVIIVYFVGLYTSPAFPYMTTFVEGSLHW